MAPQLSFQDQPLFHRQVLHATASTALAGVAIGTLAAFAGNPSYELQRWAPLGLLGLVAGLASASGPGSSIKRTALAGLAALLPTALLLYLRFRYPAFAWALAGAGFGLLAALFDRGPVRRVLALVLGLPALALAGYVGLRFGLYGIAHQLAPVPALGAVAGAFAGLVGASLMGLRQIEIAADPVDRAFKKAEEQLRGELLHHANQAHRVYQQIQKSLSERQIDTVLDHDIRDRSRELCLNLLETALRCQAIRGETSAKNEAEIRSRIDDLHKSASFAKDPVAREQYLRAAASLSDQLSYIQNISRGHERTVARIVAQLALLEKVRFSLINYRSTDSDRLAAELRNVSQQLDELSGDVDIIGETLHDEALPQASARPQLDKEPQATVGASASEDAHSPESTETQSEDSDDQEQTLASEVSRGT